MTATSVGIRMKSYHGRYDLCRYSYDPGATRTEPWRPWLVRFVVHRTEVIPVSPLFIGGDTRICTGGFISHAASSLPIDSTARWANGWTLWNRVANHNSLTRKSEAAPTGFEPVSPP